MLSVLLAFLCFLNPVFRPRPAPAAGPGPAMEVGAARLEAYLPLLEGRRVGILTNQTAVVGDTHLVDTLLARGVHIVKIFGPEHGFRGNADAGASVGDARDPETGIPVISLYGKHNKPTPEELADVDVMVYDIQDVGTRFYTYINSMERFLEAAAENDKPCIILDRPDPNGFYVDGPVLEPDYHSGVGMQPIPVVYGMTIGEYARMLMGEGWLHTSRVPDLTVVACLHYTHDSLYSLPVKPSPNLPDMASVYLYPSLCLFEGTALSVGRGTPYPFQLFGHPSLPGNLYSFVPRSMPGAMHPKLEGRKCHGFLVATEPGKALKLVGKGMQLRWVLEAYRLFPDKKNFFTSYFPKLAGTGALETQIRAGWDEARIRRSWEPALSRFKQIRSKYLLYPDFQP